MIKNNLYVHLHLHMKVMQVANEAFTVDTVIIIDIVIITVVKTLVLDTYINHITVKDILLLVLMVMDILTKI